MMRESAVLRRVLYIALMIGGIAMVSMVRLGRAAPGAATTTNPAHPATAASGGRLGPASTVTASVSDPPARRDVAGKLRPHDWMNAMGRATDLYAFISGAIPAAMHGDGRAAWAISAALAHCVWLTPILHGKTDLSSIRAAEHQFHMSPNNPQWIRDQFEKIAKRCQRMGRGSPFAALPRQAGGYSISYWRSVALADEDGLAEVDSAARTLGLRIHWGNKSTPAEVKTLEKTQAQIRAAVKSGDPDVLFHAGMLLMNGEYAVDALDGAALALAGCDMGYDCSASNPLLPWHNCQYSGACPANADFSYFLQTTGMASQYGQAYQEAQQIEQGLKQGDPTAALAAVRLRIPKQP